MKRHLALLLAFCMLLTSLPIRAVHAEEEKAVPQGVVLDTSSGNLKIKYEKERDQLTQEEKNWISNVSNIKINGLDYFKPGTVKSVPETYKIAVNERKGEAVIAHPALANRENTVAIYSKGYAPYTTTITNEAITKSTSGLSITGFGTGHHGEGEVKGEYVGVSLRYDYSYGGPGLYYLYKNKIKALEIDDQNIPLRDGNGLLNLFVIGDLFVTYDKVAAGVSALNRYKSNTKHKAVLYMTDGEKIEYVDPGYESPKAENNQINTGGLADGLEIMNLTKTGVKKPFALQLYSKIPQEQWQSKYINNIRYLMVDDNDGKNPKAGFAKKFIDAKRESQDIALYSGNLEFAMSIDGFEYKPHKLEIGFTDGNKIVYTQPGYVPPAENNFDINAYLDELDAKDPKPEEDKKDGLAQRFQIEKAEDSRWGGVKFHFKNLNYKDANQREAVEKAMNAATYQVGEDGKAITGVIGSVSGYDPIYESYYETGTPGLELKSAIKAAGENPYIKVTFSDGTFWESKPSSKKPKKQAKYEVKGVKLRSVYGTDEIDLDFGSAEIAKKVKDEVKEIKLNGKTYDKEWFKFSSSVDCFVSDDERVTKDLKGKNEVKVEITYDDDSIFVGSFNLAQGENPGSQPQPPSPAPSEDVLTQADAKTGIEVQYPKDAFDNVPSLQVTEYGIDKLNIFPHAKEIAKEAGNVSIYNITLLGIGDEGEQENVYPKKGQVTAYIPVGSHTEPIKVYKYQDMGQPKAINAEIKGGKIIFGLSENSYGSYFILSGKKSEEKDPELDAAKDALKEAIKEAEDKLKDASQYTDDSVQKAKAALAEAKAKEASTDKEAIKTAITNLKAAIKNLEDKLKDNRKLAERFQLKEVKLTKTENSKNLDILLKNLPAKENRVEQRALADAIKDATFVVNDGKPIKNVEGYCSYGMVNNFHITTDELIEAIENGGDNPHIKVTFKDGSTWENYQAGDKPKKTDNFELTDKLPDGEYTLNFDIKHEKNEEPSMAAGNLAKKAKLVVDQGKMKISFKVPGASAAAMLDLAFENNGDFKSGVETEDDGKIFTCDVDNLDQMHKIAFLITMMNGQVSDKGNFEKYIKARVFFKAPIKKGFKGWEDQVIDEAAESRRLLTERLIAQDVDTNNNNQIEPEELRNASGKLDLSNGAKSILGRATDVSMLKDLGPKVTELDLSGNGIVNIPEGLFDNMTGLQNVYMNASQFKSLPKDIFKNNKNLQKVWIQTSNLETLDANLFENNEWLNEVAITTAHLKTLPAGLFKNNTRLENIYFSENALIDIDNIFGNIESVKLLNVSDNKLISLPKEIENFTFLADLNAENNQITSLPSGMSDLTSLIKINLANNRIKSLPEDFWVSIAQNAKLNSTKYPNLDVSGNLLQEIPFKAIADAAPSAFNKFDVKRNYLKAELTEQDISLINKAGIKTKSNNNYYQPQMTAINPKVLVVDKGIKLQQDLDMVQFYLWMFLNDNDLDFEKTPSDFVNALQGLYKKYSISTTNKHLAAAKLLDKKGIDWKIQTIVEKINGTEVSEVYNEWTTNEGHNNTSSEVDPIDAKEIVLEIAQLDPGATYRVTRNFFEKHSGTDFAKKISYDVEVKIANKTEDKALEKAKADLEAAIQTAESALNNGKVYTEKSKAALNEAINGAKEALKGNDLNKLNQAKDILRNAINGLKEESKQDPAEKALQEAKEKAKAMINSLKDIEREKATFLDRIAKAKNEGTVNAIVKEAQDKNAKNKAEREKAEAARKVLEDYRKAIEAKINALKNISAEKGGYLAELKSAKDKAAMDQIFEKAKALSDSRQEQPKPTPKPAPTPQPTPTPKKETPSKGSGGFYVIPSTTTTSKSEKDTPKKEESKQGENKKFTLNIPTSPYVAGYPNGSFKPNQGVVRAEVATMLEKFIQTDVTAAQSFRDIHGNQWFADSFKTLSAAGILKGYEDGMMRPTSGVTRAQAVAMILRMKGIEPKVGNFRDVPSHAWYAGYAGAAQAAGIVKGYEDASFGGEKIITRAEIVAMINRAFNIPAKSSRKMFSDLPESHWAFEDVQKAAN